MNRLAIMTGSAMKTHQAHPCPRIEAMHHGLVPCSMPAQLRWDITALMLSGSLTRDKSKLGHSYDAAQGTDCNPSAQEVSHQFSCSHRDTAHPGTEHDSPKGNRRIRGTQGNVSNRRRTKPLLHTGPPRPPSNPCQLMRSFAA